MKIFKNLAKIFSFSHFIGLGFAIFYSVAIEPILKGALHFNCLVGNCAAVWFLDR